MTYRALYDFNTTEAGALSFKEGSLFTAVDLQSDAHWFLIVDGKGSVGYVPANYLVVDSKPLSTEDMIKVINLAMEKINDEASSLNGGVLTPAQQGLLLKLSDRRKELLGKCGGDEVVGEEASFKTSIKRVAPDVPSSSVPIQSSSAPYLPPGRQQSSSRKSSRAPAPPSSISDTSINHTSSSSYASSKQSITDGTTSLFNTPSTEGMAPRRKTSATSSDGRSSVVGLGLEMVERIRCTTQLNHELSKLTVVTVLSMLSERVGGHALESTVNTILDEITNDRLNGCGLDESSDAVRLRHIFSELAAIKDDSQQRSWILHEDEATICNHLNQLISILGGANPDTCRQVLISDGYQTCDTLALYYQMETRLSIRLLLLQTFGCMCSLGVRIINEFLNNTVLPLELARDIQHDTTDVQKLSYSALVLSMLFSTGDCIPLQYYANLNVGFVDFLLDGIETGLTNEDEDRVVDVFVKLVLAFNLHFELPDENVVMKALALRGTAKTFTEKLLLLINREVDPVKMFEDSATPNSVLKFFTDVYSSPSTATLLYSNDAKVLVDIILRQLTDLSAGNKIRTEYLSLMQLLLVNSEYFDHCHRLADLQSCFTRILQEEEELERETGEGGGVVGGIVNGTKIRNMDRDIVQQIVRQFPQHFSCL